MASKRFNVPAEGCGQNEAAEAEQKDNDAYDDPHPVGHPSLWIWLQGEAAGGCGANSPLAWRKSVRCRAVIKNKRQQLPLRHLAHPSR